MGNKIYKSVFDCIVNREIHVANAVTNTYISNNLNQYYSILNSQFTIPYSPSHDDDGNMTWNGRKSLAYDAENRLSSAAPNNWGITNGATRTEYAYDYMNRRVQKTIKQLSGRSASFPFDPSEPGTWDAIEARRYIWDGWNIIVELVSTNTSSFSPHASSFCVWGLDLSGTLQGAGGVGGLLCVTKEQCDLSAKAYYAAADANGNITEYIDNNGIVKAHYEYNAFGETTAQIGTMANNFAFRFSSKYFDPETSFYYYENRYYDPILGRWISTDPIGIKGGLNEIGFVNNDAINKWDRLGLKTNMGTERNWAYSAMWITQPVSLDGSLTVRVTYTMDKSERKCCDAVHIDRYVRKFLIGGRWGPYVLDHGTIGGYTKANGIAEDDAPDGPSFTFNLYRSSWTWNFKWIAICAKGYNEGDVLSTLMKTYRTEGHYVGSPYSGWFE